ncbi:hypothetical protein LZ554_004709 [Drepanopeziza brunnea f. sp. 'monogermtubi']|nr:hypothetical protein LZ554_004709 [Drepanopeziza brunnea f. sp. 'monogermtubi']
MAGRDNLPKGPIGSDHIADSSSLLNGSRPEGSPTVHFASANEEIEPKPLENDPASAPQHILDQEKESVKEMSQSFQSTELQGRRLSQYAFEPVSLPVSRVNSHDDSSREASRHSTRTPSNRQSPRHSPRPSSMHSPPITPAATLSRDAIESTTKGSPLQQVEADVNPAVVTLQISPPGTSSTTTNNGSSRPTSSGQANGLAIRTSGSAAPSKHHGSFVIGPSTQESSVPTSRDASPSRVPGPGPTYSRPFTPAGDMNDPYAAHKRAPQPKVGEIDSRFKFTAINSKQRVNSSSSLNLPRSSRSAVDVNSSEPKRRSIFGNHQDQDDNSAPINSKHGSMSELKRFLKMGGHHKSKRTTSPTPSAKSGNKTPPAQKSARSPKQLPFGDDHGLQSKYGKFGKVLGAGAGGSVRLMKRSSDGTTFAVKEFRARHSYETEKEYAKKVTAEFCVGSTLHHGNIIETLDIVHEKNKWYEVMEYAPYDLFAIVMTGKMSREEVTCSFLQILSGVTYLHSMGLAHRDLKLDNVVVNQYGIMKIIDFGSASVFKYPFESNIVLASGIVGSDPYLAPEVYEDRKYDPQPTDIWSLAIIFCCMSLRRFPWKMPRLTDNSYKLFASPPTPGTETKRHSDIPLPAKLTNDPEIPVEDAELEVAPVPVTKVKTNLKVAPGSEDKKPEVIKGPWRLLRLLPRESRHIISLMLQIDPKNRATMEDVLADAWVSSTPICRQGEKGEVFNAPGHQHTLEPPASQTTTK